MPSAQRIFVAAVTGQCLGAFDQALHGDFQCVRGKPKFCDEASPGIVVALESVQAAFALAWLGAPFDQTAMNGAGAARLVAILAGARPVNRDAMGRRRG